MASALGTRGRFGELLTAAGVSDAHFARMVNDGARSRRRVELGLARTTVGHWRRGSCPRDPLVAEVAAAELSRLVGYTVSPADLAWRGEEPPAAGGGLGLSAATEPGEILGTVATLSWRDAAGRDPAGGGAGFAVAAFADPVLSSVTGVLAGGGPPGAAEAPGGAVRTMAAAFREVDAQFGGGEVRRQVAVFLHDSAVAALHAGAPGRGWLAALAELAELAGWVAQDCQDHPAAQRYYIQALNLAEYAGDAMLTGRVLSAMACQAGQLGHPREALALARAALRRAERQSCATVRAMLCDKHALALARTGDEAGCTRAMRAMDRAIAVATPGEAPPWASHYGEADVAECQAHCLLLLGRTEAAARRFLDTRRAQSPRRARNRAEAEAALALAYLGGEVPDLVPALDAAHRALDHARAVRSPRLAGRLARVDAAFGAHGGLPAVCRWRSRAAQYLGGAAHPGGCAPVHEGTRPRP